MERIKKYLCCIAVASVAILVLMISAGNWIVNAGNDCKSLEDYTTPVTKTYYNTDYYDANHLFQAAGSFHIFASNQILLPGAHCNGNFAAPDVYVSAACGTNQVEASGEREMSYADKISCSQLQIKSQDIAFGKSNTKVTDTNGKVLPVGPISTNQIKINGSLMDIQENQIIYLAPGKFIDFTQEFTYLRDVSAALTKQSTTLTKGEKSNAKQVGTYNLEDNNHAYIYLADGVNVLNCTISDISAAGSLDIKGILCNKNSTIEKHGFTGTQSLMINVDCKGTTTASPGLETKYYCQCADGWPHEHGESNYYPGTIVVWNFYDSSKADNLYTGTVSPEKTLDGCYLVPNGNITITHNANGTLIGKTVTIEAGESHRADFKGKMPKLDLSNVYPTKSPTATPSVNPTTDPVTTMIPTTDPVATEAPTHTTSAAPNATETAATQLPKETSQAEVPKKTDEPNSSAALSATPKTKPTNTKTPSNKKKPSKKGNLYITVTDSKTGAVVPNATVKITKPNGETQTYTTDTKGQIKLKNTAAGKYKGVVTKVPKGYHADKTQFSSKVKAATTTKEKVKIATSASAAIQTNTSSGVSSDTSTTDTSQPKTGDNFDIRIPMVLFLLAFIGIITALILKKRSYYYYY